MNYTATQGLLTFQGYRKRSSFFGAALIQFAIFFILVFIASLVSAISLANGPNSISYPMPLATIAILLLIIGVSFWVSICISFQRMRDIGFSETTQVIYFLACFVPVLGGLLALGLLLVKGEGKGSVTQTNTGRIEPSLN